MLEEINENVMIGEITKLYSRSPFQINNRNESDAEIINFQENELNYLAVTTDCISEEIEIGLFDDPYLAGWMAVVVNLSDLAAVGAKPLGVLISEILPNDFAKYDIDKLHLGIHEACEKHATFVLGGDVNSGSKLVLTGTAIGAVEKKYFLSRKGAGTGDSVYLSGEIGAGNVFALLKLIKKDVAGFEYLPHARIKEGLLIRSFASCCMDTSDGLLAAVDQLCRLNNKGFKFADDWEKALHKRGRVIAEKNQIPSWLLAAGQHGEFELVFSIPKNIEKGFLKCMEQNNLDPIKIGEITEDRQIKIELYQNSFSLDTSRIRNLKPINNGSITDYLNELLKIDNEFKVS